MVSTLVADVHVVVGRILRTKEERTCARSRTAGKESQTNFVRRIADQRQVGQRSASLEQDVEESSSRTSEELSRSTDRAAGVSEAALDRVASIATAQRGSSCFVRTLDGIVADSSEAAGGCRVGILIGIRIDPCATAEGAGIDQGVDVSRRRRGREAGATVLQDAEVSSGSSGRTDCTRSTCAPDDTGGDGGLYLLAVQPRRRSGG